MESNLHVSYFLLNNQPRADNGEINRINDLATPFKNQVNKVTRTQRLIEIFHQQMKSDEQDVLAEAFHMREK